MSLVYFDASALVKLFVEEVDAEIARDLWDACEVAVSCRLAVPEVHAALQRAGRAARLESADLQRAAAEFERLWEGIRVVELSREIAVVAAALARHHPLSGADAIHLASALTLREAAPLFASWDGRLAAAAIAERLRVVPAP